MYCLVVAGLGFGSAYEGPFASEMAKEQLHADAQQRRFERRVSLGGAAEVTMTVCDNVAAVLRLQILIHALHGQCAAFFTN